MMLRSARWSLVVAGLLTAHPASGQALSGEALVKALQHGGYVLVVRHASSPREIPDRGSANPDNVNLERQLDEKGRKSATAMGGAIRALKIPIGAVLTSPTYRAQETVRLARLPDPQPQVELGDGGQNMQGVTQSQTAWLKNKVMEFPHGTNTILVTHLPNISAAFPQWTTGLADGETLVFGPDAHGGAMVVARITIEQWPHLSN
jgi:phosphohistidine phosphatase SixA